MANLLKLKTQTQIKFTRLGQSLTIKIVYVEHSVTLACVQ